MYPIQLVQDATLQVLQQRTDAAVMMQLLLGQFRPCVGARLAEAIGIGNIAVPAHSDLPSLVTPGRTFMHSFLFRKSAHVSGLPTQDGVD
jgi:hypothetical protein